MRPANIATPLTVGANEQPRPLPNFLNRGGAATATASAQLRSKAPSGMSCGDAHSAIRATLTDKVCERAIMAEPTRYHKSE